VTERRYELTILIGPCSQEAAEDLLISLALNDEVNALGGAASMSVCNEDRIILYCLHGYALEDCPHECDLAATVDELALVIRSEEQA
jgi:hypothetical protein